jgi:ribosome-binding factor A
MARKAQRPAARPAEPDALEGHRHARLQSLLKDELVSIVADELDDPELSGVAIAHVVLSVDYRHARVYFTSASGQNAVAERALTRATGLLRARIADAVDLKRTPDLRFVAYV